MFANALGLDSHAAVTQIIRKATDRLQGTTREALARIIGASDSAEVTAMYEAGKVPDVKQVLRGIEAGISLYRQRKEIEARLGGNLRVIRVSVETYELLEHNAKKHGVTVEQAVARYAKSDTSDLDLRLRDDPQLPGSSPAQPEKLPEHSEPVNH